MWRNSHEFVACAQLGRPELFACLPMRHGTIPPISSPVQVLTFSWSESVSVYFADPLLELIRGIALRRLSVLILLVSALSTAQTSKPANEVMDDDGTKAIEKSGLIDPIVINARLRGMNNTVQMSPENFEIDTYKSASPQSQSEFGNFLGRPAIYFASGLLKAKGTKFRDGTLDLDVASKPGGLFVGIAFRVESEANMEIVYLRPFGSDTVEAVQYTPRLNGDIIWQLLNSNHEKASAHIPGNQWIHMKLVISGRRCAVFLNDSQVPTLTVTNLRRGDSEGGVGLWSLGGGGYFSNLRVTNLPGRKPLPHQLEFKRPGLLSDWELSPALDAADIDTEQYPSSNRDWEKVQAEDPGFVLINRYRSSPAMFPMPSREEMRKGRDDGVGEIAHIEGTGGSPVRNIHNAHRLYRRFSYRPALSFLCADWLASDNDHEFHSRHDQNDSLRNLSINSALCIHRSVCNRDSAVPVE